jgi:regulator of nucleoside diphosphate kinase
MMSFKPNPLTWRMTLLTGRRMIPFPQVTLRRGSTGVSLAQEHGNREEKAMRNALSRVPDPRRPDIKVTRQDIRDLKSLLAINSDQLSWKSVDYLVRELARAAVVDEGWIPTNVVTMGSRVEYREVGKNSNQVVTVSYPGQREVFRDAISILTPVGAALIGLSAGQSICYAGPDGNPITIEVVKVLYQPEADDHGRFKPRPRRISNRIQVKLGNAAAPTIELPDHSSSVDQAAIGNASGRW